LKVNQTLAHPFPVPPFGGLRFQAAKHRLSVGMRKPPLQFLPAHRISHAREYRCSGERVAMVRNSELSKMSYAELGDMEAQIARLKIEKQNAERLELRQKLIDTAKQHGFDLHELFGKRRRGGRGTVAIKYRDPKNRENTWTGRGRMPRWMAAATKGGKAKKEDFLIG
jgi:DNA-binding protein H-NS